VSETTNGVNGAHVEPPPPLVAKKRERRQTPPPPPLTRWDAFWKGVAIFRNFAARGAEAAFALAVTVTGRPIVGVQPAEERQESVRLHEGKKK
jgi:hypothetical protein